MKANLVLLNVNYIIIRMKQLGLSKEDLASLSGLSAHTIRNFLRGMGTTRKSTIVALASALQCSLAELERKDIA